MEFFNEFSERLSALPDVTREEIIRQQYQAIGYVWGRIDAGERISSDAVWQFATAYAGQVLEYKTGKTSSLRGIQDAYEEWSMEEEEPTPEGLRKLLQF
jgi:hypothetical protein